jgi:hypothetical protein
VLGRGGLVASEEADVCEVFQLAESVSAAAAVESALSLSETALSAVWCAVTDVCWLLIRVTF